MLIRYNSAHRSGIKEYLQTGRKQGRKLSRDALDERVVLLGDLDLTDDLIQSIRACSDRYLHITIGLSERDLPVAQMREIALEFLSTLMCAYRKDEYDAYIEAHLARTKTVVNATTGEEFERLDHIHIVIPLINLLTGRLLNPVGFAEHNRYFLDAIQESLNARHKLESPKDHPRPEVNGVDIIHRGKLDNFKKGKVHRLKSELLKQIQARNITRHEDFIALLKSYGEIKVSNVGKDNEYWAVKPIGEARFVNLREPEFKPSFLALSAEGKAQALAAPAPRRVGVGKRSLAENQELVQTWLQTRAREIKYMNSGASYYSSYRNSTPEKKLAWLDAREAEFYARYASDNEPTPPLPDLSSFECQPAIGERSAAVNPNTGRGCDSITSQMLRDLNERTRVKGAARQSEFQEIKEQLDAMRLLAELSTTHALKPHLYEVSRTISGDRICHVESRVHYNVNDFLTKHMHMPWQDAGGYLRRVYELQTKMAPTPYAPVRRNPTLHQEYAALSRPAIEAARFHRRQAAARCRQAWLAMRDRFYEEKAAVQSNFDLHWTERKALLSLLQMQKVKEEAAMREQVRLNRLASMRLEDEDRYYDWLQNEAQQGREDALRELRQQRVAPELLDGNCFADGAPHSTRPLEHPFVHHPSYSFEVHRNGDVSYLFGGQEVLRDGGRAVHMLSRDDNHMELGLRLAMQKYGKAIEMTGSPEFIKRAIEVAAARRLDIEFGDPAHQAYLDALRESRGRSSNTKQSPVDPRRMRPRLNDFH